MSLNEAKKQLADAIAKYEHLQLELESKDNLESYSEQEWHAHLSNLGLQTAQLINTSRVYDDDNLLNLLKRKQNKLRRHSAWKKKHKKRVQQRKRQQLKKNEKWIKDIEWKVTVSPSVNATAIAAAKATAPLDTQQQQQQQQTNDKKLIRTLSKKLTLLTEIRALRQKKLENQGHFFADEGDAFFNKVKEWHLRNETAETAAQDEQQPQQQEKKQLVIHPQDTWHHMDIDKVAYSYWCGSDQSLDTLLNTRRLWDQYILLDNNNELSPHNTLHKVPPTFVAPAPPANAIWASYLS
ncbi:26S proteasome regulatory subunit [Mucor velutinosus]|uniref:26S proteasome regulatory subunit n=1 Tax=Mucor velutinosus TaxID=708070 RepID=A0AAN7DF15_9FUNG|nr:26S proteasome regulatory subunit [Mucor velutinosus]